jgi:hypothetical protein
MLRCYDHPEDADILAVTSETRKRREVAMGDIGCCNDVRNGLRN